MPSVEIPSDFREFNCGEYYAPDGFGRGVFDAASKLQLVYVESQIRVIEAGSFLAIGSAGADGIEFGFRKGIDGLWAFYPSEGRFQQVAPSIQTLVAGYLSGSIVV